MLTESMIKSGEYAESFLPYFKLQAQTLPLFLPELEVVQRVVGIMRKINVTKENIESIIDDMHQIDNKPHYDGSAWHGFQNAVKWWLESRGYSL